MQQQQQLPAAASSCSSSCSSMSKIRFLVGFQKGRSGPRVACYCNWPPGNLWLRLLLRHFRHEIRWCFGFGYLSKKVSGCWFLALEAAAGVRISSRSSCGTFRPPGNLLLRRILRHFWHEIRWCFAVSAVFRKRCLQQQQQEQQSSSSQQQPEPVSRQQAASCQQPGAISQ